MPTKKESSDMNSAASPRNETTRLRALATGLRLRTTAAPKITVSAAKIQKRKGDISQATDEHRSNHRCKSESKNPCLSVLIRGFYFFSFPLSTIPCITPVYVLSS